MHNFITLEGIEGCGKTSQIKRLHAALQTKDIPALLTREPGGCAIADKIRSILLDPYHTHMVPTAELLLYAAARAQHVEEVIRPELEAGKVVICDRFTDATMAYQGYARGLELGTIKTLAQLACAGIEPGLTLWLDLPVEVGIKRALQRNHAQDSRAEARFDQESLLFHSRVQHGYAQLQTENPQRIKRIDADASFDQVTERILKVVAQHLELSRLNP
ncbi:MAG: dTMP kinase [Desulfuromonadaceae bacterium]|nr:dTMP kinase [Geobacteraceae bacterium]